MNTTNNRFLITYLESADFAHVISEGEKDPYFQLDPTLCKYLICITPNSDNIISILEENNLSNIEIIGIAHEDDFTNAIKTLNNLDMNSTAYIIHSQDSQGNSNWTVSLDTGDFSEQDVISEIIVGEYKEILEKNLSYFSNPDIPVFKVND